VARPSDSVKSINHALASGKNLLLTPGVYSIGSSIQIKKPDTVVLGLGQATLTAADGAIPLQVADTKGVMIAGVMIDAGSTTSPVLLQVGSGKGNAGKALTSASDPTTLSDVYVRVGGPHVGKADVAVQINSDNVVLDNAWIWRADHGDEGLSDDTERWNTVLGRNGLVVNGANVTATGLFVEHFQQYNTIWNGTGGTTVLYQSELAYEPPTQADWMNGSVEGWAGYKVGDLVTSHRLFGGGVYVFNHNNPAIHTENGFEVPQTPGVQLHHIMTVNLGAGTIDHVVNGVGAAADTSAIGVPVDVVDYP